MFCILTGKEMNSGSKSTSATAEPSGKSYLLLVWWQDPDVTQLGAFAKIFSEVGTPVTIKCDKY